MNSRIPSIMAAVVLVGCVEAPSPVTVDPHVVVLDDALSRVVEVGPDRLRFPTDADPVVHSLQVGDIVVSGSGSGFIREVLTATPDGPGKVLTTKTVPLSAAVLDGEAADSVDPEQPLGKADGISGVLSFGDTAITSNPHARIHVQRGTIRFAPEIDLAFGMRNRKLSKFRAIASGALSGAFVLDIAIDGAVAISQEHTLWESPPKLFTQLVGVVPVVEAVALSLGVGVEVQAEGAAHLTVGGEFTGTVEAGAIYDGKWHVVNNRAVKFIPVKSNLSGNGAVSVKLYVFAELSVKFYDVAGPLIAVQPYVSAAHDADGWSAAYGLEGLFGGEIELGHERIAGFEKSLFDWQQSF